MKIKCLTYEATQFLHRVGDSGIFAIRHQHEHIAEWAMPAASSDYLLVHTYSS
jgi:hypothetical protein